MAELSCECGHCVTIVLHRNGTIWTGHDVACTFSPIATDHCGMRQLCVKRQRIWSGTMQEVSDDELLALSNGTILVHWNGEFMTTDQIANLRTDRLTARLTDRLRADRLLDRLKDRLRTDCPFPDLGMKW
jgi:hypothetical protein